MSEHYFSPQADTNPDDLGKLHPVRVNARSRELKLLASDRVFSSTHLDLGTEQLLKKAPALPASGTFLDLGCGWGPVAITMALDAPDATVWGVDVNAKALALTKLNAKKQGLKNVLALDASTALQDARDNDVRFDVIWSNPPIRIGKPGLQALLKDWLSLLGEDGVAYLVVNRHLGADSLAAWLQGQGFKVERLASRKGFRILTVSRD